MKVRDSFFLADLGEDCVLIPMEEEVKRSVGMIRMNGSGKEILQYIMDGLEAEAIADKLLETYEVDRETALKDVRGVIEKLKNAGALC